MHAVRKANQNSCLCLPGFVSRTYENLSIAQINRIPSEQTMNQKLYCSCSSFQRWLIFAWSHSSFWSRAGKLRPRYQAKAWSLFALVIFVWLAALTKKCVSKKMVKSASFANICYLISYHCYIVSCYLQDMVFRIYGLKPLPHPYKKILLTPTPTIYNT